MSDQSTVKFKTPEGLELLRQGAVPAADLIAQAEAEYGTIEVLEQRDGDVLQSQDGIMLEKLVHTLEAARTNVATVIDQLESADDVRELPEVKQQLREALDAIDNELKEILNG